MKTWFVLILLFLSINLIHAQDKCFSIKRTIQDYEALIKTYERDSLEYSQDIAKYSKQLNDKSIKEKYDFAVTFLAVAKRDKLTAISNKERLEADLKRCLASKN